MLQYILRKQSIQIWLKHYFDMKVKLSHRSILRNFDPKLSILDCSQKSVQYFDWTTRETDWSEKTTRMGLKNVFPCNNFTASNKLNNSNKTRRLTSLLLRSIVPSRLDGASCKTSWEPAEYTDNKQHLLIRIIKHNYIHFIKACLFLLKCT